MGELTSASGIPIPAVAGPELLSPGWLARVGLPGAFPFTRGIRTGMYRDRPWTIRQLAGFGAAYDTNRRYRMLLERGATGVNGVFDYPSLRAFDSDDPRAAADVGRGGVAVDVREDFDDLFAGIPLERTSVSLVSSQPIGAVVHLAMFMRSAAAGCPHRRARRHQRAMGVGAAFGSGTPLAVIVGEVARLLDGRVRVP